MKSLKVSIICALSENRAIGKDNKLIWHISDDLKRFKSLTMGHPVIMGRKTYDSIGKSLPGRTNIIITRNMDFKARCCKVAGSLEEAIKIAKEKDNGEIFIIGGGQIFDQAIGMCDKLYLTLVSGEYDGDTFFPDYKSFKKKVSEEEKRDQGIAYKFIDLEK